MSSLLYNNHIAVQYSANEHYFTYMIYVVLKLIIVIDTTFVTLFGLRKIEKKKKPRYYL